MQEPHRKGVANHPDLESCAGGGDIPGPMGTVTRFYCQILVPPAGGWLGKPGDCPPGRMPGNQEQVRNSTRPNRAPAAPPSPRNQSQPSKNP
jgi:hypothetical protein